MSLGGEIGAQVVDVSTRNWGFVGSQRYEGVKQKAASRGKQARGTKGTKLSKDTHARGQDDVS